MNHQAVYQRADPIPLGIVKLSEQSITANTSVVTTAKTPPTQPTSGQVDSIVLVIARDTTSAYSAYSGLNDRGIPYSVLAVPQVGVALPSLNDSATHGNYGLIVVLSEVSYNYGGTKGFASALTAAQWQSLYAYQVAFGVRMVRLDVAPSADTGTQSLGACCTGEQLVSISNSTAFPQAGLNM